MIVDVGLVELRPLQESDRSEFVRMHQVSLGHFAEWMPASSQLPGEAFDEQLRRTEEGLENGTEVRLAAWFPDGRIAGLFALTQIFRRAFQNAYAGWQVSADCIGRGIGTAGVIGLLDLAFAAEPRGLGLHRVQANIIPRNKPSIRVAEKAGFRYEGTALRYLHINSRWEDHLMFAKLADEHQVTSEIRRT